MKRKSVKMREGDAMVTVTVQTEPAVIDYNDIAEKCEIVPDEHADAPWENGDGYEHEAITGRQLEAWKHDADVSEMRGHCWSDSGRDEYLIRLTKADSWGIYEYARANGASRQVAAEMLAAEKRRTLDRLTNWYEHGWQYWGVKCEFRGHEASVWGVDDYDYADDEVRGEIIDEVVSALEADGYTVVNKPEEPKRFKGGYTLEGWKWKLTHNLTLQTWRED